MKSSKPFPLFGYGCLAAVLLLFFSVAQASSPKKVLLIPFTVYSSNDLTYLQEGIGQMLASRLSQDGTVQVIQAGPDVAASQNPADQAKAMGADYMVTGSLTMIGDSVSTDAKVLDVILGKQVLTFGRAGKTQADIIDHVDQLAMEINAKLFGRTPSPSAVTAPAKEAAPATGEKTPSIYQHPEKLIPHPEDGGSHRIEGDAAGFAPAAPLVLRGRRESFQMTGVATGDVDGDGRNDIVCIGPSKVLVYRLVEKRLSKMAEYGGTGHFIGVDALDVNGNGKAEIFITNFDNSDYHVRSFVLEMDGKQLTSVADGMNWYFRSVEVPNRGMILAGQRQGLSEPFAKGIFEMAWQSGKYAPAGRLPLPKDLEIYGFAYGSVRAPHNIEVVAYNPGGFIRILSRNGDEEWITSERYGGSNIFLDFPDKTDTFDHKYVYLSPRIHLYDLDGDGLEEVFAVNNDNLAGFMTRVRSFKNGRLVALKWDELGMTPKWHTRNLAKYMADFAFADVDGDGKPEVVAAVVQKDKGAIQKGRSYVAVFKLVTHPN
ncbi:MAG: VCBS repeat-containing protein [Desulfobacteraceae bacterium]